MLYEHNYRAEVLCDDGEVVEAFFGANHDDDLIACALQDVNDRLYRAVSVETLFLEDCYGTDD